MYLTPLRGAAFFAFLPGGLRFAPTTGYFFRPLRGLGLPPGIRRGVWENIQDYPF